MTVIKFDKLCVWSDHPPSFDGSYDIWAFYPGSKRLIHLLKRREFRRRVKKNRTSTR